MSNDNLIRKKVNFSLFEREVLKGLVLKERILHSRKTNAGSNALKRAAWERIAKQFSATPDCSQRTAQQLQKWWSNQKFEYRKKIAAVKKEQMKFEKSALRITNNKDMIENNFDIDVQTAINMNSFISRRNSAEKSPPINIDGIIDDEDEVDELLCIRNIGTAIENVECIVRDSDSPTPLTENVEAVNSNDPTDNVPVNNEECTTDRTVYEKPLSFELFLRHRKKKMDILDDMKLRLMQQDLENKNRVARAKEKAALAKAAYYKARLLEKH